MLSPYRVLDLSDERGQLCGQILGDLGADVILVEPPGGSLTRQSGPFYKGQGHLDRSLGFWALNRNKRSMTLDLDRENDRNKLCALAAAADFLIESANPGSMVQRGLGYANLSALNPRLIYASISAFGQDGPKANYAASDLTVIAAGGPLLFQGETDLPLRITIPQAFLHASADAAAAVLIAHYERFRSGLGQYIDVSAQQSVAVAAFSQPLTQALGASAAQRLSHGAKVSRFVGHQVLPVRDGYVVAILGFGPAMGAATERLMQCIYEHGLCDKATRDNDWTTYDAQLASGKIPTEEYERLQSIFERFAAGMTKAELLKLAFERALLIAPVATIDEVVNSPQFGARGYWPAIAHPELGIEVRYPGPFAHFSETPIKYRRRPPKLNEHQDEVFAEWQPRRHEARPASYTRTTLPLAGLKILDLFWVVAGPATTRVLADYGATVVKLESSSRLDTCRTVGPFLNDKAGVEASGMFMNVNAGKLGLTLDLKKEEGKQVFRDLVRWADVVTESFSPKAMRGWGFDYQALKQIKPEIIMVSSCLMGQTGPLSRFAGYGALAAAISGFGNLCGLPDRPPAGPYAAYTDCVSPRFTIVAILSALEYRDRTGLGQHIDLSQAEASMQFLAPAFLDFTANGHVQGPIGNHDRYTAPHGVYPCRGENSWIAIVCATDEHWSALCALMKPKKLSRDARFATPDSRLANQGGLDRIMAGWTRDFDGDDLESKLQSRGIPASKVASSASMSIDPQLAHRGHFVQLERPSLGKITVERWAAKLSRTPGGPERSSPTLGQNNSYVLESLLGYSAEHVKALAENGVLS